MNRELNSPVSVFHITQWKAGSQWLHRILRDIELDRIVRPQLSEKQFLDSPLITDAIYPTVYVTREQFESVTLPENYRKLVIIRDLRDTLISAYSTIRYSHAVINPSLAEWRQRLEASSIEERLLIQAVFRYEDLLENDLKTLEDTLLRHCEIPLSCDRLREIILHNRFENVAGGREPGEEDQKAHERKGIAGDWRNYFTSLVAEKFDARHGALLAEAGYQPTDLGA
ncbi:sulfotransferase domain-containing protein [Caballeronia sp. LjRoot34]|uniref:sulfotransferase domain-containing protein n=1 Tax=Caballeronia sp. LjRoot34 TaxID=3342325 RepID=UPI003ECC3FCF